MSNPRKHIRKYPEEKRERFLSAAELRRISEVLREMESERIELTSAILAARLLILIGCRLGEIMTLKWDYIDFDARALRLPDSKTGKKVMHVGAPAVEYLHGAPRIDGNPWVIIGTLPGKPFSDLQPLWQRVQVDPGPQGIDLGVQQKGQGLGSARRCAAGMPASSGPPLTASRYVTKL